MKSISDPSDTIEQLLYLQTGKHLSGCSVAGGATLLVYDWLLCLDREVRYIWNSRWSFAKVWFICHRYAMMALVVVMVYGSVKNSSAPSSPEWCKLWDHFIFIGTIVIIAAIQGTLVLRVCALYRESPYIIAFLGVTYFACSAAMLVIVCKLLKEMDFFLSPLTSYYACVRTCDDCTRWGTIVYVPLIVIDIVILALTVRQSFVARSQRKAAPILVTFFQDGITYFIVAFVATLVHVLSLVLGKGMMPSWAMNFLRPLLSSTATRLLLNLHEQVSRTAHYPTDPPTTMNENHTNVLSTVRFASLPEAKDVESATYDVSGCGPSTSHKSRTGGPSRCDEGSRSDSKAFRETDGENSGRAPTKMDPG